MIYGGSLPRAARNTIRLSDLEIQAMNWREFWNGRHNIYVNDRHKRLHYQLVAEGIVRLIGPSAVVLDHGCGEASAADLVADKCRTLYLFDAAATVQQLLRQQFGANSRIIVLSSQTVEIIPDGTLDAVVANSVLQYLTVAELEQLLAFWHQKLKRDGRLILADVITPHSRALSDVGALLRFAIDRGFFIAAITGLVRTFFSPYRKLRNQFGLTRYAENELLSVLSRHGFSGCRAEHNLGHDQRRMTFIGARRENPVPGVAGASSSQNYVA
jgi:SAM-dependent methyltransferase